MHACCVCGHGYSCSNVFQSVPLQREQGGFDGTGMHPSKVGQCQLRVHQHVCGERCAGLCLVLYGGMLHEAGLRGLAAITSWFHMAGSMLSPLACPNLRLAAWPGGPVCLRACCACMPWCNFR